MPARTRSHGFTLIETMIVVAVVGVLALIAVVAYQRWVRSAYLAEAHDMISSIRSAEESYRAENGAYLNISAGLDPGNTYPSSAPGSFKTAWGGPCGVCVAADAWTRLTVAPSAPVAFGYALVADTSGGTAAPASNVTAVTSKVEPPLDVSSLQGQPWYVVEAVTDLDGNGIFMRVLALSSSNQRFVYNEGE